MKCRSEYSTNRPDDRNTFNNQNKNYRIQRFKRLIHYSIRDILHLVTVKTFVLHLAAEFLCERSNESLLYFEDSRNRVAFFIGKFRLRISIERVDDIY